MRLCRFAAPLEDDTICAGTQPDTTRSVSSVEALAHAACPGVTHLAPGVFATVDGQRQLIVMRLHLAAVSPPVCQHADDAHPLRGEEGS